LAPQAGLAQVTSDGATAFHCERRWRVLLRDIFRFGTATVPSPLLQPGHPAVSNAYRTVVRQASVCVLLVQFLQSGPPRVDRSLVPMVGVVREPGTTLGAQPGTVVLAQRLER